MINATGKWARRIKRWLTLPFLLFVLLTLGLPFAGVVVPDIVGGIGLLMILIQFFAGLYLYALPYLARRRKKTAATPDLSN